MKSARRRLESSDQMARKASRVRLARPTKEGQTGHCAEKLNKRRSRKISPRKRKATPASSRKLVRVRRRIRKMLKSGMARKEEEMVSSKKVLRLASQKIRTTAKRLAMMRAGEAGFE